MQSLDQYITLLSRALDGIDRDAFSAMVDAIQTAQAEDKVVYVCGNGGSAATASHMINDLVKAPAAATGCRPLRAVALNDCIPLMTALANDIDYEQMFAKQLEAYGRDGDLLIALSGSGNSPNILEAVRVAGERGMTTIGLTGFEGGALGGRVDVHVNVPCDNIAVAEDAHLILNHAAIEVLKAVLAS